MIKECKYAIIMLFLVLPAHIILGQNYFVSNIYNNYVFSNPSFPLFQEYSVAQLNYRNHWPISNMYTSYGAAYFHYSENLNSNFGAILYYDNQYKGSFTQAAIGLNYAYKLKASRRTDLLFGLQGFYNYGTINYSQLVFENPSAIQPVNQNTYFPTINSGVGLIINNEHFIGLSGNNIYSGSDSQDLWIDATYIGNIHLQNYYSELYIQPIFSLSTDLNYIRLNYGGNIDYSGFKAGFLLNQTNTQINTFIILLGISFENYEFVYTYDLNLSGTVTFNPKMAAHEVTFLRKFQYKGRRKRYGAIKCPDI